MTFLTFDGVIPVQIQVASQFVTVVRKIAQRTVAATTRTHHALTVDRLVLAQFHLIHDATATTAGGSGRTSRRAGLLRRGWLRLGWLLLLVLLLLLQQLLLRLLCLLRLCDEGFVVERGRQIIDIVRRCACAARCTVGQAALVVRTVHAAAAIA